MSRTPGGYVIDIIQAGTTSRLIHTTAGTISCAVRLGTRLCFAVAGPGQQIPAVYDPGIEKLFTSYLDMLVGRGRRLSGAAILPGGGQCHLSYPPVDEPVGHRRVATSRCATMSPSADQ